MSVIHLSIGAIYYTCLDDNRAGYGTTIGLSLGPWAASLLRQVFGRIRLRNLSAFPPPPGPPESGKRHANDLDAELLSFSPPQADFGRRGSGQTKSKGMH